MSWIQLGNIGKGDGNPLSIMYDINFAKTIGSNGRIGALNEYDIVYHKYGVNLTPLLQNTVAGTVLKLFTLKNNNYFGIYVQRFAESTNHYDCYGTLRLFDERGATIRTYGGFALTLTYYQTEYPCYISACYDDETNSANIKMLGAYYNGSLWDFNMLGNVSQMQFYADLTKDYSDYDPNPWANAGYADVGGGDGIFNFEGDIIGLPPIPIVDAVSSGFLQLFTDDLSKIRELSAYMWSNNFLESLVKITDNPLSIIMGLYMYPFDIPRGNRKQVKAGSVLTPIYMGVPQGQIFEIDCGDFPVPSFYGAYLDFEPFSKCEIFLPYCGTFTVSLDDVSGKTVNVKYRVDLLTGACVAYLIVDGTVKYNFTGMCAVNIPISSRSFETTYTAIINSATAIFSHGALSSVGTVGSVASGVMQSKPSISHGGNASANNGYLGIQKPYFIFTVPRVAIPKQQNKYIGYPIFATYTLSELSGYTEVEKIHLENMGQATKNEIDKILSLLEGGVIL